MKNVLDLQSQDTGQQGAKSYVATSFQKPKLKHQMYQDQLLWIQTKGKNPVLFNPVNVLVTNIQFWQIQARLCHQTHQPTIPMQHLDIFSTLGLKPFFLLIFCYSRQSSLRYIHTVCVCACVCASHHVNRWRRFFTGCCHLLLKLAETQWTVLYFNNTSRQNAFSC